MTETRKAVLTIDGLTIESLRGRSLFTIFQDASITLEEDQVVLLVGPSGGGKSLLAKLIAGLLSRGTKTLRIKPASRLLIHNREGATHDVLAGAHYARELRGAVGYMFQHHALFDELTSEENIRLGASMNRTRRSESELSDWIYQTASTLKVERSLKSGIEPLSGGQRQRISLLRMLALSPEIIIYDEPTSGLDPDSATRVAELIRSVQHEGPKTSRPRLSLVVTHDYPHLLPIADRVIVLDATRRLRDVEVSKSAGREEVLRQVKEILERYEPPTGLLVSKSAVQEIRAEAEWLSLLAAPRRARELVSLLPTLYWSLFYWHAKFGWNAIRLLILNAIPFVAAGGIAVGLVLSYFSLNAIPPAVQRASEPLFIEEMIQGLGLALFKILAPLFTAICLAARSGAAVTGHVSSLERSSQLDALRVLGIPPALLLADKIAVSFMLGFPLLTAICFLAATFASAVVVLLTRPLATWYTFSENFFRSLGQSAFDLPYDGTGFVLLKLVPAGLCAGLIAWTLGAQQKESSEDVNRAITRAITYGILAVIAVFFLVLLLEIRLRR